ncbi:MAG: hypothetical protein ACYTHM_14275 [Planctomycetota bacterium]|jgi:hypothetical protein
MEKGSKSRILTWAILIVLAVVIVLWGLFHYFAIGDRGQPERTFGTVPDVPGESPYSTERTP